MICDLCDGADNFYEGMKGNDYDSSKIMFVLNKPDSRILEPSLFCPYEQALFESPTGKMLGNILKECDKSFEDIFLTNLYKCVLPEDREPTSLEYNHCKGFLDEQIISLKPEKIVGFGHRVSQNLFGEKVSSLLGRRCSYLGVDFIVENHPSSIILLPSEQKSECYSRIKNFLLN